MQRIALISVLYAGRGPQELWARALERARARLTAEAEVDVIVVDNSPNGSPGPLPDGARLIRPGRNVGFSAGCNHGLREADDANLVVLLNPDAELAEDFLVRLTELSWPEDLAARGPAIRTPGDRVEQSARAFPTARTGFFGRSSLLARVWPASTFVRRELRADPHSGTRAVDWVTGACLIAPRDRFDAVGPLDEGYFLYWEDADWCRRARERGMHVEYEPSLRVVHHQGASASTRPFMTVLAFHRSAFRYWRIHVSRSRVATALAALALACRCTLKLAGAPTRLAKRGRRRSALSGASSAPIPHPPGG